MTAGMIYLAEPRSVPRIWGSLPGKGDSPVGELWWIYHDGTGSTTLTEPGGGEVTLEELVLDGLLPGRDLYPVMVKTLHTASRLSVQVHPGREGGSLRKDETWIILRSQPGSWMLGGLAAPVGPGTFEGLRPEDAERLLGRISLSDGDVWHIPPGTVHALGGGLEVLEIQDSCDVTYRLYDWGRTGPDGRPRELHLEEGLASMVPPPGGGPLRAGSKGRLTTGLPENCRYAITDVQPGSAVCMGAGELLFLASGRMEVAGAEVEAPACLLAGPGGGDVQLTRGIGYLVTPGGDI